MKKKLSVLALEPYYGGSHKAFLDQWCDLSGHDWTVLGLPPYKWRWRLRHSGLTFARQVEDLVKNGKSWDVIFCSDMLDLVSFRGLAPREISNIPTVVYFHENQLTYPVRDESQRDYQSAYMNFLTAIAGDSVWFNSSYNLNSFLDALPAFLKKMPDYRHKDEIENIRSKSKVMHLGINPLTEPVVPPREPGPLHILWSHRWDFDKNAEDFFEAMRIIREQGVSFKLSVGGERFRNKPEVFAQAEKEFEEHIVSWEYKESYEEYLNSLKGVDVAVSTANHEFFGISMLEAAAAGAFPLLPERLAYPEVFSLDKGTKKDFFFKESAEDLAERIIEIDKRLKACGSIWLNNDSLSGYRIAEKYFWNNRIDDFDEQLIKVWTTVS